MRYVAEKTAKEVLSVEWCGLLWDIQERQGEEVGRKGYSGMPMEELQDARGDNRARGE